MKTKKTLRDHCIIYDDECPMCELYTGAFVNYGFLEKNGRRPFSKLRSDERQLLDLARSKNEIPLINTATGQVTYGLSTLLNILSHRWAVFGLVKSFKPLLWLVSKCYRFISFNRKVMVPGSVDGQSCVPSFHLPYRLVYLILGILIALKIFSAFYELASIEQPSIPPLIWFVILSGQYLFPLLLLFRSGVRKALEYAGNLTTITLVGAMMMLPALIFSVFTSAPPLAYIPYLIPIGGVLIREHIRRVKLLQLSPVLWLGWVVYWLLILVILM